MIPDRARGVHARGAKPRVPWAGFDPQGTEDYEYLCVLRDLTKRARGCAGLADPRRATESALDRARVLVTIPNAGGMRSTEILPNPDVVPPLRRALAEQIVKLKILLAGSPAARRK